MTAARRVDLLSLDEWRALGEDTSPRSELQEGVLMMSPSPRPRHQYAETRLAAQLLAQVPMGLLVAAELDVILDPAFPPTVRCPDVLVQRTPMVDEVTADLVVLVVEILSPGTHRRDRVTKRSEYADAGIPHYWIVDLEGGPSMQALTLVDGVYVGDDVTGEYRSTAPFDLRIDLAALT